MPSRLLAILLCLVAANVVNYGVNQWLEREIPGWSPPRAVFDGSSLSSSLAYQALLAGELPADSANVAPLARVAIPYYEYLAGGGGEAWLAWRDAYDRHYGEIVTQARTPAETSWNARFLHLVDRTAPVKYLAVLLVVLLLVLLRGNFLRPQSWVTPVVYLLFFGATAALYTAYDAPAFVGLVAGGFLAYAAALWFILPIYTVEWNRALRPLLTPVIFFLMVMSWRGPEWLDYLFWTSPLYRLALVSVLLISIFFHLNVLHRNLVGAKLELTSRLTGYAMPLGVLNIFLGLFLGFFRGQGARGPLFAYNQELLWFSPGVVERFDPNLPFWLFFAGVALLIVGGIGYFIQRIAR